MSVSTQDPTTPDRTDRMMTLGSGVAALVALAVGLFRLFTAGANDVVARGGIVIALALGLTWVWGRWPNSVAPVSGWTAAVLAVFSIHRSVLLWGMDWWTWAGLILALFLLGFCITGRWQSVSGGLRGWTRSGGLNTTLVAVGLVVSLIMVNAIVRLQLPQAKWDLTQNQRFTLAPQTRQILNRLPQPVRATLFAPAGARAGDQAQDLLTQYGDASRNFQWTRVDPLTNQKEVIAKNPTLAPPEFTGAVVEYGGKREQVSEFTEKSLTSAVLKLTRETPRKILFLKGHGEPEVTASGAPGQASIQLIVRQLQDQQWPVESVDLYPKDAKAPDPAQVALLVIAGPRRELAPAEEDRISEYLNAGGRVLMLLDVQGSSQSRFLAKWGIKVGDGLVTGPPSLNYALLVAAEPTAHEAVRRAGDRVVMELARNLSAASPALTGITVTELLSSGQMGQLIPNYAPGKPIDPRNALQQPASVAMLAEKAVGGGDAEKKGRLVVFGGTSWFTDKWTQQQQVFNFELANGVVNYLGEEEALVAIPPKDENTEQVTTSEEQKRLLRLVHLAEFPLLALLLAVMVYLWRR